MSEKENPIENPEVVQNPEQPQQDPVVINILNVANLACLGSGNRADANERRILVGINLLATAFGEMSENAKRQTLNNVINTLIQASGLQMEQEQSAPPPEAEPKAE